MNMKLREPILDSIDNLEQVYIHPHYHHPVTMLIHLRGLF